ncbi:MAG: hypothetical protein HONDAALG_04713 [Gammaproteobacteria bacterium]|jgi:sterol desaturase/sphingolipid hydroxylase (fatty acid hydroxylase superfamily)|nr:hypothetical protein [Gammaproteobacteria bacterium]
MDWSPTVDVILYAVPFFVVFIVLELLSYRYLPDDSPSGGAGRGYETRDTATSLTMGIGSVVINLGWKLVVLAAYTGLYVIAPVHLSAGNPLTWIALFLLEDLAYYWYHRTHHTVRMLWASHVVHHSSRHYNLSTALRQSWTPFSALPFWLPLAFIGFPPWMILAQQSISLIYQFFLHTERVGKLWAPIEFVFNTPSHHRVHHGSNTEYLDKNYGGILIIWDRIFGSFQPEGAAVVYGLTKNIDTYNPLRVATHEFAAIGRDLVTARSAREVTGYLFKHPGWEPG